MKKQFIAVLIGFAMAFSIQSCTMTNARDITVATLGVPQLITDINGVVEGITTDNADGTIFSDEDLNMLLDSSMAFEMMKTQYDSMMKLQAVPNVDRILIMWSNSKRIYLKSIAVIDQHRDKYSVGTTIKVDMMKLHAANINVSIDNLLKEPSAVNVSQALNLIGLVIQTGVQFGLIPLP